MKYFHCKTERKIRRISAAKSPKSCLFPFSIYSTWAPKSIYSTFKIERFVCENEKYLTKLFSRLIDIFCMSKHEVNNDG